MKCDGKTLPVFENTLLHSCAKREAIKLVLSEFKYFISFLAEYLDDQILQKLNHFFPEIKEIDTQIHK